MLTQTICRRCYKEFCHDILNKNNRVPMSVRMEDFYSLWEIDLVHCRAKKFPTQFHSIKDPPPPECSYQLEYTLKDQDA